MGVKSGQVLILVLLAVVVVLAIGLSVASRNITNLRTTTQTEESQRAFTAAEGGVESVIADLGNSDLSVIRDDISGAPGNEINRNVPVGDLEASVHVKGSNVYERSISLGDVAQINLNNFQSRGGSNIQVEWGKNGTSEIETGVGPASIEVTLVYDSGNKQARSFFTGGPRTGESIILSNEIPSSVCGASSVYVSCETINISGFNSAQIIRIKPFWLSTTVRVSDSGSNLSLQTFNVSSVAESEIGVTRKIEVSRTDLPQLPAIFDYVLFSESDIIK